MDFAEILDGIARPVAADDACPRPDNTHSSEFWRVLDGFAAGAGASEHRTREAYRANAEGSAAARAAPARAPDPQASVDAADIRFELGLDAAASIEDLRIVRRLFARANHPDRVAAAERERANRRMTIANALIDEAAARFQR